VTAARLYPGLFWRAFYARWCAAKQKTFFAVEMID
jgi:hypothetical protein